LAKTGHTYLFILQNPKFRGTGYLSWDFRGISGDRISAPEFDAELPY